MAAPPTTPPPPPDINTDPVLPILPDENRMHEQNTKTTTKPKGEYEKRELRKKEEEIAKREIYAAREKLRRDTAIYGDIFYDWEAIMREREVRKGRNRKEDKIIIV